MSVYMFALSRYFGPFFFCLWSGAQLLQLPLCALSDRSQAAHVTSALPSPNQTNMYSTHVTVLATVGLACLMSLSVSPLFVWLSLFVLLSVPVWSDHEIACLHIESFILH